MSRNYISVMKEKKRKKEYTKKIMEKGIGERYFYQNELFFSFAI